MQGTVCTGELGLFPKGGDLQVEAGDELSPPVTRGAQMVRLMKTGMAILERTQQPGIRRTAQTLVDQLYPVIEPVNNGLADH